MKFPSLLILSVLVYKICVINFLILIKQQLLVISALSAQNLFPFAVTLVAGICADIFGCRCRCVVRMLVRFYCLFRTRYRFVIRILLGVYIALSHSSMLKNPICCVKDSNYYNILVAKYYLLNQKVSMYNKKGWIFLFLSDGRVNLMGGVILTGFMHCIWFPGG